MGRNEIGSAQEKKKKSWERLKWQASLVCLVNRLLDSHRPMGSPGYMTIPKSRTHRATSWHGHHHGALNRGSSGDCQLLALLLEMLAGTVVLDEVLGYGSGEAHLPLVRTANVAPPSWHPVPGASQKAVLTGTCTNGNPTSCVDKCARLVACPCLQNATSCIRIWNVVFVGELSK